MTRKLLFIPPVLIGLAILYLMAGGARAPERKPAEEEARAVRIIAAEPVSLVPRAIGYGSVYPGTVWTAIAQVSGKVEHVHRELKKGAILAAGSEIVRISPADFALAIKQAEANIRSTEARLAELSVSETNTADLIKIEERGLDLREAELERKQNLFERGTIAQAAVELEQRETLAQRKKVQDLKNALRLLPTQRAVQREQIAVYQAQLRSAELDLERTRIALPFNARIAEVNVEDRQFVQAGAVLVEADSLDVAEIEAQFPISDFRSLVRASAPAGLDASFSASALSRIIETIGFEATVRLRAGNDIIEWPGRFARVSDAIDPKTRTVGVIVAVEGAYASAQPGQRPPLTKGMFVEIEIRTRPIKDRIAVPRASLHNGALYVVSAEDRLEIRPVTVAFAQGDLAVIGAGIEPGERIVVSDLIPAVEAMLLRPRIDEALAARLRAQASAAADLP